MSVKRSIRPGASRSAAALPSVSSLFLPLTFALLVFAVTAHAQGVASTPLTGARPTQAEIFSGLGLTQPQRSAIATMGKETQARIRDIVSSHAAGAPLAAADQAEMDRLSDAQHARVVDLLTPPQRARLAANERAWRARMDGLVRERMQRNAQRDIAAEKRS